MILRGARQVGKTTLLESFAQEKFADYLKINFDNGEDLRNFEKVDNLKDFEEVVKAVYHKQFNKDTLVFIDEIQNLPNIIKLLRFFWEDRREIPVVAAGSLLEVKIKQEGFSLPVGRVEFAYLYPLSFFEFLDARGEDQLLAYIKEANWKNPLGQTLHQKLEDFFLEYVLLGGMPEVVKTFVREGRADLARIYQSLLQTYAEDLHKYSSQSEAKYLRFVFDNAPFYAGSLVHYQNFAQSEYRTREMQVAFEALRDAMLLETIFSTGSKRLPLTGKNKRPKKLLFLDSGLASYKRGFERSDLNWNSLDDAYKGGVFEQTIGQNLKSLFANEQKKLFYWSKEKARGAAEVDFCFESRGKIVGLEVKAGVATRARSLFSFASQVENSVIVRIYPGPLRKERVKLGGDEFSLVSLPFYLIERVLDFID